MKYADDYRRALGGISFGGFKFVVSATPKGDYFLQIQNYEKCSETGEPKLWNGRKWLLEDSMTEDDIVRTAFMAVLTWQEHEARERFLVHGRAIFGPHAKIGALWAVCEKK